jgi:hypothetical protein
MEVTLYDGNGHPVGYVANDDDNNIYLWSGHAVAYLDGEKIYGWNGNHLGWFSDGLLYDLHGQRVGSIAEKCPHVVYAQPVKHAKYAKFAKYAHYPAYARPGFSSGYSNEPLEQFLKSGAVGST